RAEPLGSAWAGWSNRSPTPKPACAEDRSVRHIHADRWAGPAHAACIGADALERVGAVEYSGRVPFGQPAVDGRRTGCDHLVVQVRRATAELINDLRHPR